MKTDQKIYVALAILAVFGLALWMSQRSKQKSLSEHSAVAAQADLPTVAPPKDDIEKITRLQIKNADKADVTLEKKGDAWEVVKPISAKANASNVRSLLDNLKELKVKEAIDRTASTYPQYELTDEKAVHVTVFKGEDKALDLFFGKSGSRGQMVRIAGKDGVYVAGGYSSYLYTREVKNWRETAILKFEDANAIQVEVENKNGKFSFSKNDDKWSGTFAERGKDGKLKAAGKKWEKFDDAKVKDMLRAYKALNAEDFGDDKADTGLADAVKEGGIVKIKLKDNAGDHTVKVGKTSKGSSRYAQKEGGEGITYVLSSWSADWAVAEQKKFEKSDDKGKDKDKKPEAPPPPMEPDEE
jgi:Domain of unknown function (DUF4340)